MPHSYYSFIYCSSPNSPRHYLPLHSRFSRDYTRQLVSWDLLQMKFTAIRSLFLRYWILWIIEIYKDINYITEGAASS